MDSNRAIRLRLLGHLVIPCLAACSREASSSGAPVAGGDLTPASAYGVCAPCHHADGLGVPNAFPSLVGTTWMTGDPEVAIKLTLHGLQGPIVVNGRPWNALMMPLQDLPDAQIAAALTHARTSWGNAASAITPAQVMKVRSEHAGRARPWTAGELGNPR